MSCGPGAQRQHGQVEGNQNGPLPCSHSPMFPGVCSSGNVLKEKPLAYNGINSGVFVYGGKVYLPRNSRLPGISVKNSAVLIHDKSPDVPISANVKKKLFL